jgi:hypothetical protein
MDSEMAWDIGRAAILVGAAVAMLVTLIVSRRYL